MEKKWQKAAELKLKTLNRRNDKMKEIRKIS